MKKKRNNSISAGMTLKSDYEIKSAFMNLWLINEYSLYPTKSVYKRGFNSETV